MRRGAPLRRKTPLRSRPTKVGRHYAKPKDEADRLFSLIVRTRGRCEGPHGLAAAPHNGPLQCAHIIGRRYLSTRWLEENALCLCSGHHYYYTQRPEEWRQFVGDERYQHLWQLAQVRAGRVDYPLLIVALQQRLARVTGTR